MLLVDEALSWLLKQNDTLSVPLWWVYALQLHTQLEPHTPPNCCRIGICVKSVYVFICVFVCLCACAGGGAGIDLWYNVYQYACIPYSTYKLQYIYNFYSFYSTQKKKKLQNIQMLTCALVKEKH